MAENSGECFIFEEDEVFREANHGLRFGVVVRSSEYLSSDEDDEDSPGLLKKGTLRVAWHPSGHEETVPQNKVKLADRSLMPGDVVRRLIAGQDSQRGYTQNLRILCHAQIKGTNDVILNISSSDLVNIVDWPTEPGHVTLNNWVGRVTEVSSRYTLSFPDGARCTCDDDCIVEFEDLFDKRGVSCTFNGHLDNYVGQRLKGEAGDLKGVTWLKTTRLHSEWAATAKPSKPVFPAIELIETSSVQVNWLYCGFGGSTSESGAPPSKVTGENLSRLRLLNAFENCESQIGDIYFYTVKKEDCIKSVAKSKKKSYIHYVLKDITDCLLPKQVLSKDLSATQAENIKNVLMGQQTKSETLAKNENMDCAKGTFEGHEPSICEQSGLENQGELNESCVGAEGLAVDDFGKREGMDNHDDEYEDVADESDADSVASATSAASNTSSQSQSTSQGQPSGKRRGFRKGGILQTKLMKKKGKPSKSCERPKPVEPAVYFEGQTVAVEIIWTSTLVDVMWQDGTTGKDILSTELYPIFHLDDNEFFPGDFVLENVCSGQYTYGFIVRVNHRERTCHIKWVTLDKSSRVASVSDIDERSVYDVKDHTDYKFRPGNIVVRLDVDNCLQESSSQTVGQVCYLMPDDGKVEVIWQDGSRSLCSPQELYLVAEEDESDSDSDWETSSQEGSMHGSSSEESDNSWETESEASTDTEALASDSKVTPTSMNKKHSLTAEIKPMLFLKLEPVLRRIHEESHHAVRDTVELLKARSPCLDTIARYLIVVKGMVQRIKVFHQILQIHQFDKRGVHSHIGAVTALVDEISAISSQDHLHMHIPLTIVNAIVKQVSSIVVNESLSSPEEVKPNSIGQEQSATSLNVDGPSQDIDSFVDHLVDIIVKSPVERVHPDELNKLVRDSVEQDLTESDSLKAAVCDLNGSVAGEATDMKCNISDKNDPALVQEPVADDSLNSLFDKVAQVVPGVLQCLVCQSDHLYSEVSKQAGSVDAKHISETTFEENAVDVFAGSAGQIRSILNGESGKSQGAGLVAEADECLSHTTEEEWQKLISETVAASQDSTEQNKRCSLNLEDTCIEPEGIDLAIEGFKQLESAPLTHKYFYSDHKPDDAKAFSSAFRKEIKLLRTSLPHGILVRCYEDRMDLFSVLITGPRHTPYEDGLFAFDFQLPNGYNSFPPLCHYHSYCNNRLNPNLYEDGKVCVSLLGTWNGKGNEVWTTKSSLLQVLVSIQGLILVAEPYYNEAGYEKQRGSQQASENSQMYNEMAAIKMVQSMTGMVKSPPEVFKQEVYDHFKKTGDKIVQRLSSWLTLSDRLAVNGVTTTGVAEESCTQGLSDVSESAPGVSDVHGATVTANSKPGVACKAAPDDGSCCGQRVEAWRTGGPSDCVASDISNQASHCDPPTTSSLDINLPEFPLLPMSRGCRLSLTKCLEELKKALEWLNSL